MLTHYPITYIVLSLIRQWRDKSRLNVEPLSLRHFTVLLTLRRTRSKFLTGMIMAVWSKEPLLCNYRKFIYFWGSGSKACCWARRALKAQSHARLGAWFEQHRFVRRYLQSYQTTAAQHFFSVWFVSKTDILIMRGLLAILFRTTKWAHSSLRTKLILLNASYSTGTVLI